MSYQKMPPQAYTRETLQEAFEWWSGQDEELKTKIQDRDDLVGYFLKVKRRGGGVTTSDAPEISKESFSTELKGLVKDLDAFEDYQPEQVSAPKPKEIKAVETPATASFKKDIKKFQTPKTSVFEPSSHQLPFPDMSKRLTAVVAEEVENAPVVTPKAKLPVSIKDKFFKLDTTSQKTIKEVREALNLSSDDEALRAVIALGSRKIKSLF